MRIKGQSEPKEKLIASLYEDSESVRWETKHNKSNWVLSDDLPFVRKQHPLEPICLYIYIYMYISIFGFFTGVFPVSALPPTTKGSCASKLSIAGCYPGDFRGFDRGFGVR